MSAITDNHFEIISKGLSQGRYADEDTFSSIAVLADRLERLKKSSSLFADVTFSPQIEELASQEMFLAIS